MILGIKKKNVTIRNVNLLNKVKACNDLTIPEHKHYTHTPNSIYKCPDGCDLKWENICQIITHLEDHLTDKKHLILRRNTKVVYDMDLTFYLPKGYTTDKKLVSELKAKYPFEKVGDTPKYRIMIIKEITESELE